LPARTSPSRAKGSRAQEDQDFESIASANEEGTHQNGVHRAYSDQEALDLSDPSPPSCAGQQAQRESLDQYINRWWAGGVSQQKQQPRADATTTTAIIAVADAVGSDAEERKSSLVHPDDKRRRNSTAQELFPSSTPLLHAAEATMPQPLGQTGASPPHGHARTQGGCRESAADTAHGCSTALGSASGKGAGGASGGRTTVGASEVASMSPSAEDGHEGTRSDAEDLTIAGSTPTVAAKLLASDAWPATAALVSRPHQERPPNTAHRCLDKPQLSLHTRVPQGATGTSGALPDRPAHSKSPHRRLTQFPHAHSIRSKVEKAAAAGITGIPREGAAAQQDVVHVDTELLRFCEDYFRNLE